VKNKQIQQQSKKIIFQVTYFSLGKIKFSEQILMLAHSDIITAISLTCHLAMAGARNFIRYYITDSNHSNILHQ
jgi:hypothetical protein